MDPVAVAPVVEPADGRGVFPTPPGDRVGQRRGAGELAGEDEVQVVGVGAEVREAAARFAGRWGDRTGRSVGGLQSAELVPPPAAGVVLLEVGDAPALVGGQVEDWLACRVLDVHLERLLAVHADRAGAVRVHGAFGEPRTGPAAVDDAELPLAAG